MSTKSRKTREVAADQQDEPAPTPAIPWPEWTDAELNAEKWDVPKNGTDGHFLDPEPRVMPHSVAEPADWKRGSVPGNLSGNPVVFAPSNEYPDFVKNNKHIMHSQFVRWFISTMTNLQYVGREGLQVEGESANFTWLGKSRPWQGWMYVYSANKAGSSAPQHRPVVNPNGKYVVRLFFMGFWRRFIVDDMIPIDKDGTPLLPRTERDFELWPMLLAKAMMKLAALSWTSQREINDFYPVSCFTGWICLPLVVESLSQNEKWNLLTRYADRGGEEKITADKRTSPSPDGEENTDDNKATKRSGPPLLIRRNPRPAVLVFANLTDATVLAEETAPGVTPRWSHPVYIDELKDINADASQVRWKLYRYFDWVSRRGTIGSGNGPECAARSLKLISPLVRAESGERGYVEEGESTLPRDGVSKVSGDVATGITQTPDTAILLPDIGVWRDFGKVAPYLGDILVYHKPSAYEYYARVSDLLRITSADSQLHVSAGGSRVKSRATGGKDGKKAQTASASSVAAAPSFRSSLKCQPRISSRRNDPLYMLIDSIHSKFVVIDFCSMTRTNPAYGRSYVIVEGHNLFERPTDDDDPVASITTFSTGATIFEAEPGRHLYRIFFRSGGSYFVRIVSDTIFHLGDRFRMQDLMSFESERVDAIAKEIGDGISAAVRDFGSPGFAGQLRAFYNSYTPRSKVDKKLLENIHRLFVEELEKLVNETFPIVETNAIRRALRVFFLDPTIGIPADRRARKEDRAEFSTYETAAVRIQSFFRMLMVKIYKNTRDPSHVGHSEVLRSLGKVVELFNHSTPEPAARFLIRKMINGTCTATGPALYPCQGDLSQVLKIEEWRGVVRNVQPGQWVPILRVVVNVPREEDTVHAGIDLVTSLPRYVIRVVNNETYREVTRFVNKVSTARYPYVGRGYTLMGYGWSDGSKFKELDWRVRVTTVKGQPTFRQTANPKPLLVGAKPPSLVLRELSNTYVPNVWNIIGKWIVAVSVDSLLSFRLSTSYGAVETVIKITDKDGNVLCEATGGSVLILPVACLSSIAKRTGGESASDVAKTRNRSRSLIVLDEDEDEDEDEYGDSTTEYFVRAYVANDSWPLTPAEWTVANDAKAEGTVYDPGYGRTSVSSVSKRSTRPRIPGRGSEDRLNGDGDVTSDGSSRTMFQHPLCRLQVLVDVGTKVHVEKDRRREAEISGLKRLWEDAEPGRLLRGRELREEFFKRNSVVLTTSTNSADSVEVSPGAEVSSIAETRTLKPTSNQSRVLPPWNIAAYVSNDDEEEEERWVKTEDDEEMLRNRRAIYSLDFDQAQAVYVDEDVGLIRDRRQRYSNLFGSYVKKIADWKSLGESAREKRDAYVAEVKAALSGGIVKTGKGTVKRTKKEK